MAALTLYILVHFGGDSTSYQDVVKTKLGKIPGFVCELILIFYLRFFFFLNFFSKC